MIVVIGLIFGLIVVLKAAQLVRRRRRCARLVVGLRALGKLNPPPDATASHGRGGDR